LYESLVSCWWWLVAAAWNGDDQSMSGDTTNQATTTTVREQQQQCEYERGNGKMKQEGVQAPHTKPHAKRRENTVALGKKAGNPIAQYKARIRCKSLFVKLACNGDALPLPPGNTTSLPVKQHCIYQRTRLFKLVHCCTDAGASLRCWAAAWAAACCCTESKRNTPPYGTVNQKMATK
jgi:hypothetical protein